MVRYIRKLPGFRSGSKIKAFIATCVYGVVALLLFAIILPKTPSLAITSPHPTNKDELVLSGKAMFTSQVYLLNHDGDEIDRMSPNRDSRFQFVARDLEEGINIFTIRACGDKEKCVEERVLVTKDTIPPQQPVIAAKRDDDHQETVRITGTTNEPGVAYSFIGEHEVAQAHVDEVGAFAIDVPLQVGENAIAVKIIDVAGNESVLSDTITIWYEPIAEQPGEIYAIVTRVIDGDTIELATGETVRYIGIDTPETKHPNRPVECYGELAAQRNTELVLNKEVRLEKDVSETDRFGRLLRYVWLGEDMVNEVLVQEGFAQATSYPPDVKHQEMFTQAQEHARNENRGLWGECGTESTPTPIPTLIPTPKPTQVPPVQPQGQTSAPVYTVAPTKPPVAPQPKYPCDCKKTCPNISSCEEAQYLLNVCGCTARDGDKDGIACDGPPLNCQQ